MTGQGQVCLPDTTFLALLGLAVLSADCLPLCFDAGEVGFERYVPCDIVQPGCFGAAGPCSGRSAQECLSMQAHAAEMAG